MIVTCYPPDSRHPGIHLEINISSVTYYRYKPFSTFSYSETSTSLILQEESRGLSACPSEARPSKLKHSTERAGPAMGSCHVGNHALACPYKHFFPQRRANFHINLTLLFSEQYSLYSKTWFITGNCKGVKHLFLGLSSVGCDLMFSLSLQVLALLVIKSGECGALQTLFCFLVRRTKAEAAQQLGAV